MTKEITKAYILQEMQDKLGLREFESDQFLFGETVTPVYNIEQHLESWWQDFATVSITAIGGNEFYVVPQNERWHLTRYNVVFMTGDFTVAGVYIYRKNQLHAGAYTYLDLKAGQTESYQKETDAILVRGDKIKISVDGYTSTGDLRLYIDYKRELQR